ncbi:hypothetical protein E2562_020654 [Oryza meyeriana var. granulata]|uniref:Uncharacterized protein n=1 Tax=Oryza meyeriana var. granulata TaxID=110450 RepID=A0A6G1EAZ7_9ORYZ|nr:hypothetical protein E2562_020654 [Oryza meyeriana var. granulata]
MTPTSKVERGGEMESTSLMDRTLELDLPWRPCLEDNTSSHARPLDLAVADVIGHSLATAPIGARLRMAEVRRPAGSSVIGRNGEGGRCGERVEGVEEE